MRRECKDSSHLAEWLHVIWTCKYLKGRAWVGLVNEESTFVLSQGLWRSLCGPRRSPLLQFPSPKLMHLVLSPGIEPVPQSGFIGPALTLFAHLAHRKQADGTCLHSLQNSGSAQPSFLSWLTPCGRSASSASSQGAQPNP